MKSQYFDDLGVFLAHSATLEREAAERFYELAAMMKVHNNDELHRLFLELARYSVEHVNEVEAICQGYQLPSINPWDYQWPGDEAPENLAYEQVHYLLSPIEALAIVHKVELSAEAFYRKVSIESTNEDVRRFALLFATEEHEHAETARTMQQQYLDQGHQYSPRPDQLIDLDPPVMPE
ncbi:MAG: ferritin family protein [Pseudomonadales bacterium]|nr:ferritin family protein [Pseudomonadales bacterium]